MFCRLLSQVLVVGKDALLLGKPGSELPANCGSLRLGWIHGETVPAFPTPFRGVSLSFAPCEGVSSPVFRSFSEDIVLI